jgi:hypothetical protein
VPGNPAVVRPTPALPCPECRQNGRGGEARIGNRRRECPTCNAFAQNVMRLAFRRFREREPEQWQALRLAVELDLYPNVIEAFAARTMQPTTEKEPDAARVQP